RRISSLAPDDARSASGAAYGLNSGILFSLSCIGPSSVAASPSRRMVGPFCQARERSAAGDEQVGDALLVVDVVAEEHRIGPPARVVGARQAQRVAGREERRMEGAEQLLIVDVPVGKVGETAGALGAERHS